MCFGCFPNSCSFQAAICVYLSSFGESQAGNISFRLGWHTRTIASTAKTRGDLEEVHLCESCVIFFKRAWFSFVLFFRDLGYCFLVAHDQNV